MVKRMIERMSDPKHPSIAANGANAATNLIGQRLKPQSSDKQPRDHWRGFGWSVCAVTPGTHEWPPRTAVQEVFIALEWETCGYIGRKQRRHVVAIDR